MIDISTVFYSIFIAIVFVFTAWSCYNVPIVIAGVKAFRTPKHKRKHSSAEAEKLPSVSIIVPVKNEEKTIRRLIDSLAKIIYPTNKLDVIIVEDGSTDSTLKVCTESAKELKLDLRILQREISNGKPSALNFGIRHAKGDVIAVFDADSVLEPDILLNVSEYFEDESVAAVQGRTQSINSEQNMLTKFTAYEEAAWCEAYLRGKDVLNLFVSLKGTCQFIRSNALKAIGTFDEKYLAEDMELSARLVEHGYKIRYASNAKVWQESPSRITQLLTQRTRWYRGWMEVALSYGRLMRRPSRVSIDAEATLLGPFMMIASLATYLSIFFVALKSSFMWQVVMQTSSITTILTVVACGSAMIWLCRPMRARNLLWLPFVYGYSCLQAFIALYAAGLIMLHRPQRWLKTEKDGVVAKKTPLMTNSELEFRSMA